MIAGKIYRGGKAITSTPTIKKELSNSELIIGSPNGLASLWDEFSSFVAQVKSYSKSRKQVPQNQQLILNEIHTPLANFFSPFPLTGKQSKRISVKMRNDVKNLYKTYAPFNNSKFLNKVPKPTRNAAKQLIEATLKFVDVFEFIDNSYIRISNRPSDFKTRGMIATVFQHHNQILGKKGLPNYPKCIELLGVLGLSKKGKLQLSERAYYNYKKQWLNGTYYNLIH
jgi:hypothetical protein